MRLGWLLGLALAGPAFAQEASGLDRAECVALLAKAADAREEAETSGQQVQGALLEAHGPIRVEIDPTQPLIDDTASAWDAFDKALGDLCRDKI